jgi:hypothetical protein
LNLILFSTLNCRLSTYCTSLNWKQDRAWSFLAKYGADNLEGNLREPFPALPSTSRNRRELTT